MTIPPGAERPLSELPKSGLLWLINRVVFHPQGVAFALHFEGEDNVTGWSLRRDPEGGPWHFPPATDRDGFERARRTLDAARTGPRLLACGLCYEEDGEEVHPHPECTADVPPAAVRATAALTKVRAIPRVPHWSQRTGQLGRAYTRGWESVTDLIDTALTGVPGGTLLDAGTPAQPSGGLSSVCRICGSDQGSAENFKGDGICACCADCDCGAAPECIRTDLHRPQSWACTGACREPFHGLARCQRHHRPHPVDGRPGLWHEGITQDGSTLYWQDGDPGATPHVPPGTCTARWWHHTAGLILCAEESGHCTGPDCWHWGVSEVTGVRMQWKEGIPDSTPPDTREDTARTAEDTTRTPRPRVEVTVSTDTDTPASTSGDTPRTRRPVLSMNIVGKSRTVRQDTAEDSPEDTPQTTADTDTDSVSDDERVLGPDGFTDVERTRKTIRDTLRAELSCDDDDAIWQLTLAIARALRAMPRHARTTEVQGICPACRRASLFLGSGGYVTCARLECTAPDSATTVLENPPSAADECGRADCANALQSLVFLHHEARSAYDSLRFNVNAAAMWLIDYKHQGAFARARQSRHFLHGLSHMLRDRGPLKPIDQQGTSA